MVRQKKVGSSAQKVRINSYLRVWNFARDFGHFYVQGTNPIFWKPNLPLAPVPFGDLRRQPAFGQLAGAALEQAQFFRYKINREISACHVSNRIFLDFY